MKKDPLKCQCVHLQQQMLQKKKWKMIKYKDKEVKFKVKKEEKVLLFLN